MWDPANAFSEFGEEPEAGAAALGPFLRHVHLKDVRRPPDGKIPWPPVLPGRGDFPAARVLDWLTADGRDHWVSFEWEKRWHPEIEEPEVALPALPPLGRRRAARAARHGAHGRAGPHLRSPARRGLSEPAHDGPRRGARRGRGDPRPHGARRPGRRHLRLRSLAERVPGRAAAGARDRLAEAHRVPPRRVRRHRPRPPGLLPTIPRRPALRPRRRWPRSTGSTARRRTSRPSAPATPRSCGRQAPALAILGIGENGHLAFIDPPVCDFAERADVRVVELDEPCRRQQVNDGCFPSLAEVPRTALSLTVPLLMRVPRAVAIVPGPAKRAAIAGRGPGPGHDRLPRVDPAPPPRRDALPGRGLAAGLGEVRARPSTLTEGVTAVTADSSGRTSFWT